MALVYLSFDQRVLIITRRKESIFLDRTRELHGSKLTNTQAAETDYGRKPKKDSRWSRNDRILLIAAFCLLGLGGLVIQYGNNLISSVVVTSGSCNGVSCTGINGYTEPFSAYVSQLQSADSVFLSGVGLSFVSVVMMVWLFLRVMTTPKCRSCGVIMRKTEDFYTRLDGSRILHGSPPPAYHVTIFSCPHCGRTTSQRTLRPV
ncbi:MAG: hypothetical protein ABSD99_00125 [Candidatus Bathyarchaeia archaeon]